MAAIEKLKFRLVKSPLGRHLRYIQGKLIYLKLSRYSSGVNTSKKTVYCISPYKTGTTYLSSVFSSEVAMHEPIHYITYKLLDKDFDKYFVKRMNYLGLKLECSGCWSAYIDQLANHEVAKDLEYICILRPPSSWITSVINYWNKPTLLEFQFQIAIEFFWKNKVGVDLRSFNFEEDTETNKQIINKLIDFYFKFTNKTRLLNNITYIHLKEINENLPLIESLINEKTITENGWKKINDEKKFIYKNENIDKEYKELIDKLQVSPN